MRRYPAPTINCPTLIEASASSPHRLEISDVTFSRADTGYTLADWELPDAALKRSFDDFYRLIANALEASAADAGSVEHVKLALGAPPGKRLPYLPLLSNLRVRNSSYELLFEHLRAKWAGPTGTRRRWFFGTLITDMGNTLEYVPVIEMGRLRRDFRKVIARTGLNTIAFIEIQAGTNYPQNGHGRTLMCHAHFIGFTDDQDFDLRRANAVARAGSTLTNWLGAPTARIEEIAHVSALKRRCYYLFKAPLKGSYLVRNAAKGSGWETKHADVDQWLAVRLAEMLAQIDYRQATFTTGEGTKLKGDWLRALAEWQRPRRNLEQENFAAAFQEVWTTGRTTAHRAPAEIRWTTNAAPSTSWNDAMTPRIQAVSEHRARFD